MVEYITKYLGCSNPLSLAEHIAKGGFCGLKHALHQDATQVIATVKESGLLGRGGAYFPTGKKWELVSCQRDAVKYLVCNADEGEPGTFKDRRLLCRSPLQILEGMLIAAYAIGANKGFIYIRGEYQDAAEQMKKAVDILNGENLLGNNILGSSFSFEVEVCLGAGAYICGEETALLESLEGKRGIPRLKPPFPGQAGLWGHPTLINNVETLCNLPLIFELGLERYLSYGLPDCRGTKLISLSGAVKNPGVYEIPFGTPLGKVIYDLGGLSPDKAKIKFVQIGGLSGKCIRQHRIDDICLDIAALGDHGLFLGSGAVHVAGEQTDVKGFLESALKFFAHESCGRCTPCREGIRHLVAIVSRMTDSSIDSRDKENLAIIADVMREASFCGLGQSIPAMLESLLDLIYEVPTVIGKE